MSLREERDTLAAMIRLFCQSHHHGDPVCEPYGGLRRGADER